MLQPSHTPLTRMVLSTTPTNTGEHSTRTTGFVRVSHTCTRPLRRARSSYSPKTGIWARLSLCPGASVMGTSLTMPGILTGNMAPPGSSTRWQRGQGSIRKGAEQCQHYKVDTTHNRAEQMDLFRCRASRLNKDDLCAVDSTSISTYGFNLVDIRWGSGGHLQSLRFHHPWQVRAGLSVQGQVNEREAGPADKAKDRATGLLGTFNWKTQNKKSQQ